jgi:hypothetical protein
MNINPFLEYYLAEIIASNANTTTKIINVLNFVCKSDFEETRYFCHNYYDNYINELSKIDNDFSNKEFTKTLVAYWKLICYLSHDKTCTNFINENEQKFYEIEKLIKEDDIGLASIKFVDFICDIIPDEEVTKTCKSKVAISFTKYLNKKCDL